MRALLFYTEAVASADLPYFSRVIVIAVSYGVGGLYFYWFLLDAVNCTFLTHMVYRFIKRKWVSFTIAIYLILMITLKYVLWNITHRSFHFIRHIYKRLKKNFVYCFSYREGYTNCGRSGHTSDIFSSFIIFENRVT